MRLNKKHRVFQRAYLPGWREEVFVVQSIYTTKPVVTYKLTEWDGTPIKDTFYEQDVQKVLVRDDALFRVYKVLKRKDNKVLVAWKYWPRKYDSWIWKKRYTSFTMNEFRITLISDPTEEFPKNQNNSFKVRLPTLFHLPGQIWKASVRGFSVSDQGQSSQIISPNAETELVGCHYTLTQRHQGSDGTWNIA